MIFRLLMLTVIASALAAPALAQGTVGPGELPKRPNRIEWTDKTKGLIIEVNPDILTMRVKDEVTNKVTTYRIIKNARIEGDKKMFGGKKEITVHDLQKGQRIQIVFYQNSPEVARQVKVLKPKN